MHGAMHARESREYTLLARRISNIPQGEMLARVVSLRDHTSTFTHRCLHQLNYQLEQGEHQVCIKSIVIMSSSSARTAVIN